MVLPPRIVEFIQKTPRGCGLQAKIPQWDVVFPQHIVVFAQSVVVQDNRNTLEQKQN